MPAVVELRTKSLLEALPSGSKRRARMPSPEAQVAMNRPSASTAIDGEILVARCRRVDDEIVAGRATVVVEDAGANTRPLNRRPYPQTTMRR